MKKLTLEWFYAACIRSLKTMAQTALGMFTVGSTITEITWFQILSVSVVAGLYSFLTSIVAGLPETNTDGTLHIDTNNPVKDTYRIAIDTPLEDLGIKKKVTLTVDPTANLSQE